MRKYLTTILPHACNGENLNSKKFDRKLYRRETSLLTEKNWVAFTKILYENISEWLTMCHFLGIFFSDWRQSIFIFKKHGIYASTIVLWIDTPLPPILWQLKQCYIFVK
jgi:hypothetical protein